jgi:hypothetical protein
MGHQEGSLLRGRTPRKPKRGRNPRRPKRGPAKAQEGGRLHLTSKGAVGVGLVPPRMAKPLGTPLSAYIKRWRGAPKMYLWALDFRSVSENLVLSLPLCVR